MVKSRSPTQPRSAFLPARLKLILSNITIEPAMFLISFSGSLDDVSVKEMLLRKSCKIDFQYNDTVCNNLLQPEYKEINDEVQNEIAQFNVWVDMITSIFPIFFAFYLGAWCDTFGRKLCMYLFLIAKSIGQGFLIVNAANMSLKKEWYLLTFVPSTLVGGYSAFSIGLSGFIADISAPDQRAFRMGMIHLSQSLGRPIAAPLGAYLLEKTGFVGVTSASFVGVLLGLIFLYFRMKSFKWVPAKNAAKDRHPFSLHHVNDALQVTFKKRPEPNRKYMFILMAMMIVQTAPFYGESIAYYFVRTQFEWDYKDFSQYSSIVSALGIAAQAICIPLLAMLNVRDSLICVCVLFSNLMRNIIKGVSTEDWMFYFAACVDLIGSYSFSLIRAMLTCCVPLSEFGKVYAVISALDNILPLGLSQLYASLWKWTSDTYPGAAFLVSAGFTLITLSLAIYIHLSLRGKRFSEVVKTSELNKMSDEDQKPVTSIFDFTSYEEATRSSI